MAQSTRHTSRCVLAANVEEQHKELRDGKKCDLKPIVGCTFAEYFELPVVVYSKDTDKADVANQLKPYIETARDKKSGEMIREVLDQVVDGHLELSEVENVA
jgi:hypothetical protein